MPYTLSDVHPYLLHFGHLLLPTYGLLAAVGLMAALSLSLRTALAVSVSPDTLWNAGVVTVVAAFVLSRLLLIAFNLHSFLAYPILLLTVPSLTPIGLLLTAMAAIAYLWRRSIPIRAAFDAWAPCATLLWAFLAIGHFAEGSDPGLPTASRLGLPASPGEPLRLQPVSLYAALCALALTFILLRTLRPPAVATSASTNSPPRPAHGTTAALGLVLTGLAQFLLTFLRQPSPPGSPASAATLLDPIQALALGLIVAGALLYLTPQRIVFHAL